MRPGSWEALPNWVGLQCTAAAHRLTLVAGIDDICCAVHCSSDHLHAPRRQVWQRGVANGRQGCMVPQHICCWLHNTTAACLHSAVCDSFACLHAREALHLNPGARVIHVPHCAAADGIQHARGGSQWLRQWLAPVVKAGEGGCPLVGTLAEDNLGGQLVTPGPPVYR